MNVNPIQRRCFSLALILILLLLISAPLHAQDGGLQETFDDPALPGWEHSENVTVADGVLRVETGGFAFFFSDQWSDLTLTLRARRVGDGRRARGTYCSGAQNARWQDHRLPEPAQDGTDPPYRNGREIPQRCCQTGARPVEPGCRRRVPACCRGLTGMWENGEGRKPEAGCGVDGANRSSERSSVC